MGTLQFRVNYGAWEAGASIGNLQGLKIPAPRIELRSWVTRREAVTIGQSSAPLTLTSVISPERRKVGHENCQQLFR